jgi:hypothetical protein
MRQKINKVISRQFIATLLVGNKKIFILKLEKVIYGEVSLALSCIIEQIKSES